MSNNITKNGGRDEQLHRANPLDVAWLAGAFDGEGSIYGRLQKQHTYSHMRLDMKISNVSMVFMAKVQKTVESVCFKKFRIAVNQVYKGNKIIYCIEITNQRSIQLLCEALLPYLTVKKAQAEVAIEFCESRKHNRHYGSGYTDEELSMPKKLRKLKDDTFDYAPQVEGVEAKRDTPNTSVLN